MQVIPTAIPGVHIIAPQVFGDERGHFYEAFNAKRFADLGITTQIFVQDNQSRSPRGILRGLHYQIRQTQDKLVRCLQGAILDVVVDVRRGSPTFGRHVAVELTGANQRMLWVPKGFAHGFLVISDSADVLYKVTDYWSKDDERGLCWNDPALGIAWPELGIAPQLNARDAAWPRLGDVLPADLLGSQQDSQLDSQR